MIELDGVSKKFGGTVALARTSLAVTPETTLALIGPSGCGKSTLLRLTLGLIHADEGTVRVAGTALDRSTVRSVRHKVGMMLQDGGLFPHLTAVGNVGLLPRYLGWSDERIAARTAELRDLVDLPEAAMQRFPSQLSGGQRQRVALIRALMLDPPVLLLDEPMAALDPMVRAALQEDLQRIFRALRKTVLLVTHDMAEAAFMGDEIALMREGAVLQRGSAEALLERPVDPFVTEFIRAQRRPWPAKAPVSP